VDLKQGLIYLAPEHQKNRERSSVPLTKTAKAILKRRKKRKDATVFPVSYVNKTFKRACKKAGLDDFTIHDLRHTCAAWLVQHGTAIRTVAEFMRHKDIRVTMRYAHLSQSTVRDAISVLDNVEKNVETGPK
jgi:integrase